MEGMGLEQMLSFRGGSKITSPSHIIILYAIEKAVQLFLVCGAATAVSSLSRMLLCNLI